MKLRLGSLISALIISGVAHSFPANSRLGYGGNCNTCHHSPTGGGALTGYGSSTANEISTFTIIKETDAEPSQLIYGFDSRYLYLHTENRELSFPMQTEIELGAQHRGFKIIGQIGMYGDENKVGSFRLYALYTRRKHTIRVGKFAPAFGLNEPDHTLPGRNGFGFDTRSPSLNLEYTYSSKHFSVNTTAIGGFQGPVFYEGIENPHGNLGKPGFAIHASVFRRGILASLSGAIAYNPITDALEPIKTALSWVVGNERIYSKFEYALMIDAPEQELEGQGWMDLMFVPVRGVHIGPVVRSRPASYSYGSKLIWFPTKGLEITTLMERSISQFNDASQFVGTFHIYL